MNSSVACVVKLWVLFTESCFCARCQYISVHSDASACCHKTLCQVGGRLICMVEWDIFCMISDSVFLWIPFFLHVSSKLSCLHFRVDQMSESRFPYKLLWSSSLSTSYHNSKVQKSRIYNCIINSRYNLYIQLAVVAGWQDQTIREEASTGSCFPRRNALRIVRWASTTHLPGFLPHMLVDRSVDQVCDFAPCISVSKLFWSALSTLRVLYTALSGDV